METNDFEIDLLDWLEKLEAQGVVKSGDITVKKLLCRLKKQKKSPVKLNCNYG